MSEETSESTSLIGQTVAGRYVVERLVGQSDTTSAYFARHQLVDQPVLLKVLEKAFLGDEGAVERFESAAKLGAKLRHPCIVVPWESGELDDGRLYSVQDWFDGESVRDLVGRGAVKPTRAVRLLMQLAGAVKAIHEAGLVHGRIQAPHVIVDEEAEQVALVGFSGSRPKGEEGVRADLRGLGAVFFELLVGAPPPTDVTTELAPAGGEAPREEVALAQSLLRTRAGEGLRDVAELLSALEVLARPKTAAPERVVKPPPSGTALLEGDDNDSVTRAASLDDLRRFELAGDDDDDESDGVTVAASVAELEAIKRLARRVEESKVGGASPSDARELSERQTASPPADRETARPDPVPEGDAVSERPEAPEAEPAAVTASSAEPEAVATEVASDEPGAAGEPVPASKMEPTATPPAAAAEPQVEPPAPAAPKREVPKPAAPKRPPSPKPPLSAPRAGGAKLPPLMAPLPPRRPTGTDAAVAPSELEGGGQGDAGDGVTPPEAEASAPISASVPEPDAEIAGAVTEDDAQQVEGSPAPADDLPAAAAQEPEGQAEPTTSSGLARDGRVGPGPGSGPAGDSSGKGLIIVVALVVAAVLAYLLFGGSGGARSGTPPEPDGGASTKVEGSTAPPVETAGGVARPTAEAPAGGATAEASAEEPPSDAAGIGETAPPGDAAGDFTRAADEARWSDAAAALEALASRAPEALDADGVGARVRKTLEQLARDGKVDSAGVFLAVGSARGGKGAEILYRLIETRGQARVATLAADALRDPKSQTVMSDVVRVAFGLRDKPCNERLALIDEAARLTDQRILIALEIAGRGCFPDDPKVNAAVTRVRDELRREKR